MIRLWLLLAASGGAALRCTCFRTLRRCCFRCAGFRLPPLAAARSPRSRRRASHRRTSQHACGTDLLYEFRPSDVALFARLSGEALSRTHFSFLSGQSMSFPRPRPVL